MNSKKSYFLFIMLQTSSEVIDALGGTQKVAEMLGVGSSAVSNYRKLGFPRRTHYTLAKACQIASLRVSEQLFGAKPQISAPPRGTTSLAIEDMTGQLAQDMRIGSIFDAAGYERIETPILQPAEPFLNRLGETMRRRMYLFTDPAGEALCLRPDLTVPTCRYYLAQSGAGRARHYRYQGTAFRYRGSGTGEGEEFTQAGIENIGGANPEIEDAEVLALTLNAVHAVGVQDYSLMLGDIGLFTALIDSLPLAESWRFRLKQRFSQAALFSKLLQEGSRENGNDESESGDILSALSDMDEQGAQALIAGILQMAGLVPGSGRDIQHTAQRFLARARDKADIALSKEALATIEAFLAIEVPAEKAMDELRALGMPTDSGFGRALSSMAQRFDALEGRNVSLENARFSAQSGQKFAYYTGFLFELNINGKKIGGGGRYDKLLKSLGSDKDIPAIGGALSLERLYEAVGNA
ncbi:MAG: ATP phosphoribosyltransferase regulatory subunit [Parvibaculales bacterium]